MTKEETSPEELALATLFSSLYSRIDKVVEGFRRKWTYKASVDEDFDDIKSEIITHIWVKFNQYDSTRDIEGWVAQITRNKFKNKLRDKYLKTSSPCRDCAANLGDGLCAQFGTQSVQCSLYKKWYEKKRFQHEAKMPLPMENHLNEIFQNHSLDFDVEVAAVGLHMQMKKVLTDSEWIIYKGLYIDNKEEKEVASEICSKDFDGVSSKRIRQVKLIIIKKAKVLLKDGIDCCL